MFLPVLSDSDTETRYHSSTAESADVFSFVRKVFREGRLYIANHVVAWIPSHFLRLLYYRVVMKAEIGERSSILMGAWLDTPRGLTIGTASTINQKCRLDSRGGITIGNNVSISAEVAILTAEHNVQSPDFAGIVEPVTIGDYVFIGTRAIILPGVTLGEGSVVAAGAVVTKNVLEYSIVGGIPARVLGTRARGLRYNVHYRRLFQ
jgi:maltose O-acetyltransferase